VLHESVNGVDLSAFDPRRFEEPAFSFEQHGRPPLLDVDVGDAMLKAASNVAFPDVFPGAQRRADRFGTAQAFVLGVQHVQGDERREAHPEHRAHLEHLGRSLLNQYATRQPGPPEALVDAIDILTRAERVEEAAEPLQAAFGGALHINVAEDTGLLTFQGMGALLATMLLDLATNLPKCWTREAQIEIDGVEQPVTMVEIDACTHAPFDRCKHGVSPLNWPNCNPYFLSVKVQGQATPAEGGWSATVRERVGPAVNLSVYETDLVVRYFEQPGLATVSFDLAPKETRGGDKRVTYDLGFVSVTDEGVHRRFRTMKLYRIDDLATPLNWICPLWCWQVVMAGWWCP